MFVSGKLYHLNLMFAEKARQYLSEAPGRLRALPTNIRLDWIDLQGTKYSSLLRTFVSNRRKWFYKFGP